MLTQRTVNRARPRYHHQRHRFHPARLGTSVQCERPHEERKGCGVNVLPNLQNVEGNRAGSAPVAELVVCGAGRWGGGVTPTITEQGITT